MITSGMVNFHSALEPMLQPIDSVLQHPQNPNNGDVEEITTSIQISGMYRPVCIQKSTRYIVAGNHTWLACKQMGAEQVPVVELDIDDMTALRILLADNQIPHHAYIDEGALLENLKTLAEYDSLMGSGYTPSDLAKLMAVTDVPLDTDDVRHKNWPTLFFKVPPHVKKAFLDMTEVAVGDRERFEMLLRLAGWSG